MSTKDLLDRLENNKQPARKPVAPPDVKNTESKNSDTRVASGVVRRRGAPEPAPPPPPPPKTIRRPGTGRPDEVVRTAPQPTQAPASAAQGNNAPPPPRRPMPTPGGPGQNNPPRSMPQNLQQPRNPQQQQQRPQPSAGPDAARPENRGQGQPQGQPKGQPQGQPKGEPQGQPKGEPQGQPQGQPKVEAVVETKVETKVEAVVETVVETKVEPQGTGSDTHTPETAAVDVQTEPRGEASQGEAQSAPSDAESQGHSQEKADGQTASDSQAASQGENTSKAEAPQTNDTQANDAQAPAQPVKAESREPKGEPKGEHKGEQKGPRGPRPEQAGQANKGPKGEPRGPNKNPNGGAQNKNEPARPTEPGAPGEEKPVRREEPTMERAVIVERPGGLPPRSPSMGRGPNGRPAQRPGPGGPLLPGLGSAVVSLPPGYDPSDPTGARRRAREATPPAGGQRWSQQPGPQPGRRDGRNQQQPSQQQQPQQQQPQQQPPQQPAPAPASDARRKPRSKERNEVVLDDKMRRPKGRPLQIQRNAPKPAIKRKIRIDGEITVANLAHGLGVKAPELVRMLMAMGQPATINQFIDFDTATILASEFGAEIVNVAFSESEIIVQEKEEDKQRRVSRPPVVTVMGHVDHGKTTLLDTIRKARVAAGEAGGITQHIGAYQVKRSDRLITFIDTPGHAAFSAMRARGAKATDIVVLVVAADDGVMPQTIEAISHAKAANVPIVVAVNKCDKPGIQPERIRQMLMEYGLVPEEFGGDTLFTNVSALKGTGVDELLDNILLVADVADLRANPERKAEGVVLEARLETGKGAVASLLVQTGTLRQGDEIVIGTTWGRVRAMMDDRGAKLKEAGPATPVEIFGLQDLPNAGDMFAVVESERDARALVEHRQERERTMSQVQRQKLTAEDLFKQGVVVNEILYVVLKADVSGSLEALKGSIEGLQVAGTLLKVLHAAVGPVNESDINLAAAEKSMVIAFNVKADAKARQAADAQNVEIRRYDIIYTVIDDLKARLTGMLAPVYEERRIGEAEVRVVFSISKIGKVAGCMVLDGKAQRSATVKVLRAGKQVAEGKVSGLKRFKDDVKEVEKGFECGVSIDNNFELEVNDRVVFYNQVEVPRG